MRSGPKQFGQCRIQWTANSMVRRSETAGRSNAVHLNVTPIRSRTMSRIRSRGNSSTELVVARHLRKHGISGWRRHLKIAGSPDFVFPRQRVAVFVHGCFWHYCQRCSRGHVPHSRQDYWRPKLLRTRLRDQRNRRLLRRAGYRTVVIWEHELETVAWIGRVKRALTLPQLSKNLLLEL